MRLRRLSGAILILGLTVLAAGCKSTVPEGTKAESGGYRDDVATVDLQAAVADELGENYWPDADIPEEFLSETYGLTEDLYEEVSAQMPMISANVDTLIIVKAKEGSEQKVEEALNAYKEYNTTEALQYPMNMGKVQAAQIKAFGRYVCFVQLGADMDGLADEGTEEGDAAAIKHCEQVNANALSIIENMLMR